MKTIDFSAIFKIFGQKHATAGLFSGANHKSVPERKSMEPVKIDRCQNICHLWNDYIELRKDFDLPTRDR